MLLLVTNREDLTADWLIVELQRRGASYVRFNTEDYPRDCKLSWSLTGASLRIGDSELAADSIDAVWYRRPVAPRPRPGLPPEDTAWVAREAAEALDGFWRTLDARWVSRPDAIRRADSKPQQLSDAAALGFEIPETEITSDPERVRQLLERSTYGIICKPLRDGRVRTAGRSLFFTTLVSDEQIDRLGDEPQLFQALVAKRYDLRVTVIGEDVFGTRIDSQAAPDGRIDWRRASPEALQYFAEDLPPDIVDRCRRLVRHYGLRFAAIDLARRTDGGYSFFELNPNGQWAFVEQRTDQPLRARLADVLLGTT